ncbi:hypothetical protein TSOC_008823 [Tetrabaena socialis]|uniref:Sialate O-acetylesterase domain-containing protein n=1 Tax=Tetrabaena socialis TaxID=47790 RepID=A0A2J7ZXI2_9CHLO|nr:hypothetical protein TSOC_008823 [Tetrabaena socialis]|eukprot:PNH04965.1 hypothetical protein TSOC_008823 [Tetrabaena socialis]
MGFGRVLLQMNVSARVGFVAVGLGSTSLMDDWCPGCKQYNEMMTTVARAMAAAGPSARLRGMVWVQGESDTGNDWTAGSYRERFSTFLATLRADLSPHHPQLPVVLSIMSARQRVSIFPYIELVRSQQAAINDAAVLKVDQQDYAFYLSSMADPYNPSRVWWDQAIHMTQDGQCDMGADMAAAYAASGMQ